MKLFSNIISFVFHPLLMVTYGIVLALMFTFLAIYPLPVKLLIAGGTFISTAIVPGLFMETDGKKGIYRKKSGKLIYKEKADSEDGYLGMYLFPV